MPKTWKEVLKQMVGLAAEPDATKRAEGAAALLKAAEDLPEPGDGGTAIHKADDPMCKCADCVSMRAPDSVVSKRLHEIEKTNTDLAKANSDLMKRLDTEIEKRENDEMVGILKSFKATPFDLAKDPSIFRKMRKNDPEVYERTMTVLKATDAQAAMSGLYSEFGSGRGAGEGSAWSQIEAKAEQLVEKSGSTMTKEAAVEKVTLDPKNMELVKRYRAEMQ